MGRAALALAAAAQAWGGRYETPARWPPCGRVDARAEGIEVIVRVIPSELTHGLRTFVRAYAGEPRGGVVSLRRRTLPWWVGRGRKTGVVAIDRRLFVEEERVGAVQSFLGERLRGAISLLMDQAEIDELSFKHGAVGLLVRGLGMDVPTLDAAFEVAVAAGSWRAEGSAYR
jgi:hypothetical protein